MTVSKPLPRSCEFRARVEATPEPGTISGVAAPLGVEIDQGWLKHVIEPGAFAAQAKDPARVKLLYHHDWTSPIGALSDLTERDGKVWFTGRILDSPKVPKAQEALELVREGVLDEVSVGFEWVKWTEEHLEDGSILIRHSKARLNEISVVTFGAAGRDATIKTAAARTGPTVAEWRQMLGLS